MKKIFKNKFNNRFYNVTLIIILVNIFMYLLQVIVGRGFTDALKLVPEDVFIRPWILLSSMFLHDPTMFFHIFFNMYVLMIFGSLIERKIGSKRFLAVYLLAGLVASIAYSLFPSINPLTGGAIPALGASGAVFAVVGITIMLLPQLQVLLFFIIPMSLRTFGFLIVGLSIFGLFSSPDSFFGRIGHVAHLAGLIVGLIYGYYLIKKKNKFTKKFVRAVRPSKNKKDTIEMSDDDIEEYLKNGRL